MQGISSGRHNSIPHQPFFNLFLATDFLGLRGYWGLFIDESGKGSNRNSAFSISGQLEGAEDTHFRVGALDVDMTRYS